MAHDGKSSCEVSDQQASLASARQSLERSPRDLQARLALADGLVKASCYEEAVHVLQDGEPLHPRNQQLQTQLQTARSLIKERQFFEGLDQAELAAQLSRHALRCTRFGDVAACDQALVLKPNDVAILIAKGDALMKAERPIEAIETYGRAGIADSANADVALKLKTAQTLRTTLETRCAQTDGEAALAACEAVFRTDAPNGFELARRLGVLHQAANRSSKALEAYITANSLRRGDKAVALAILALVDSTGRSDAVALAARGSSLVTLRRARDGLASMRQAFALAPELPGLANQIEGAERLLKQEARVREQNDRVSERAASTTVVDNTPTRSYSNVQPASHAN
jgi:tetratricopeptide (TPR) repeat protein